MQLNTKVYTCTYIPRLPRRSGGQRSTPWLTPGRLHRPTEPPQTAPGKTPCRTAAGENPGSRRGPLVMAGAVEGEGGLGLRLLTRAGGFGPPPPPLPPRGKSGGRQQGGRGQQWPWRWRQGPNWWKRRRKRRRKRLEIEMWLGEEGNEWLCTPTASPQSPTCTCTLYIQYIHIKYIRTYVE